MIAVSPFSIASSYCASAARFSTTTPVSVFPLSFTSKSSRTAPDGKGNVYTASMLVSAGLR